MRACQIMTFQKNRPILDFVEKRAKTSFILLSFKGRTKSSPCVIETQNPAQSLAGRDP